MSKKCGPIIQERRLSLRKGSYFTNVDTFKAASKVYTIIVLIPYVRGNIAYV